MPLFTFRCRACGEVFDKLAKYDDILTVCSCGEAAQRAPFYREQSVISDRAAPPKGPYADEAQKRNLAQRGWGIDDTYAAIRKSVTEDGDGHKRVDTQKIPLRGSKNSG